MASGKLTDQKIKNEKSGQKDKKLSDGHGLFLLIKTNDSKLWRLSYRFNNKQQTISLGKYPVVNLKEARERTLEVKRILADGKNPSEERKKDKLEAIAQEKIKVNTFKNVAQEWLKKQTWSDSHTKKQQSKLNIHIYPSIGDKALSEIKAIEILDAMEKIEQKGSIETAHRSLQIISQVFVYAVIKELAVSNVAAGLSKALTPVRAKNYPTMTKDSDIAGLLRAINGYSGLIAKWALQLLSLTAVRPGELRHAEWTEISTKKKKWIIPAHKMKIKGQGDHIVPLSNQTVSLIEEIRKLTGDGKYLFPSERSKERPISDNTMNAALRRMGIGKEEFVAHGFRAMFSTVCNEHGHDSKFIEKQLAHKIKDSVEAAYNRALYLEQRNELMQWWADYLDGLK